MLFHKYGGVNVVVTNFMSHSSIFVPSKDTVNLDNVNTGHAQVIGIILCYLLRCSIIYPIENFYYFPGYPYNTISTSVITFHVGFQKVTYETIEHCDFLTLKVILGDHLTRIKTVLTIFK